jgi:hypothetical protein
MATVKDAQFRVTLMTLGLSRLTAMGSDTKADLLPPGFDLGTDGRTTPQKNAEESSRSTCSTPTRTAATSSPAAPAISGPSSTTRR